MTTDHHYVFFLFLGIVIGWLVADIKQEKGWSSLRGIFLFLCLITFLNVIYWIIPF
jgi:hypothetical protein